MVQERRENTVSKGRVKTVTIAMILCCDFRKEYIQNNIAPWGKITKPKPTSTQQYSI